MFPNVLFSKRSLTQQFLIAASLRNGLRHHFKSSGYTFLSYTRKSSNYPAPLMRLLVTTCVVQILPSHTSNTDDNNTDDILCAFIPLFYQVLENRDVSIQNLEENVTLILNALCSQCSLRHALRPPKSSGGSQEGFSTNPKTMIYPRPT